MSSGAAYTPKAERMWRLDPVVEAARKLPGWAEFHRACGIMGCYFDHIERESRRGQYAATAFTAKPRKGYSETFELATGRGATPVAAIADAFRKCGVAVPAAEEPLARLLAGPVAVVAEDTGDGFDELLGDVVARPVDDESDFEGLL